MSNKPHLAWTNHHWNSCLNTGYRFIVFFVSTPIENHMEWKQLHYSIKTYISKNFTDYFKMFFHPFFFHTALYDLKMINCSIILSSAGGEQCQWSCADSWDTYIADAVVDHINHTRYFTESYSKEFSLSKLIPLLTLLSCIILGIICW